MLANAVSDKAEARLGRPVPYRGAPSRWRRRCAVGVPRRSRKL